ncbi:hypothetical protein IX307_001307 [Bacteroides pyogenes]|uniref:Glyoxalase/fosfomycin resistance/dioxygenase domain-containing protein n=2 Tax=Bacteroides pyogenes TaxID=310300 RepID=W4PEE7_9BACE|nr:VOC family protein [Bacteroides pyogenes]GAE14316.1 hypothetical protein JCM6292_438 [Bacteroides pyogenes JCM 6292]MBR8720149.1 hypothetical protein [Bacteroides pyogenes]MBR8724644.1 hypothetical protein [Bacteroides pyogenes]MBR8738050.1 hypothetical protein [Bacteroides pyogenes]MBR8753798.1 hypothetical protein [Bacteroides pyogenes]
MSGVQHIGIPTNDIQATIAFYKRLGFDVALSTQNNDEKVAFLQLHNLIIETYENHSATLQTGAIDHISINVNSFKKVV